MSASSDTTTSSGGGGGDAGGIGGVGVASAPFSGQLSKFTNVMKGWQPRWFVLDGGRLDYYLTDERGGRKRRGGYALDGALVLPSDEDSQTFHVQFAGGDSFKLRAVNVRERQMWVDRVRAEAQKASSPSGSGGLGTGTASAPPPSRPPLSRSYLLNANGEPSRRLQHLNLSVLDAFGSVEDILRQTAVKNRLFCNLKTYSTYDLPIYAGQE